MRLSLSLISLAAVGQSPKFEPPRRADGHPDLQGLWRNSAIVAAFNVEGQTAFYNEPGGKSVIVDPQTGNCRIRRTRFTRRTIITCTGNEIQPGIAIRME